MKTFALRMFDLTIIALLVFGGDSPRTFAQWTISAMVIVGFMAAFTINKDIAIKAVGRSLLEKTTSLAVIALYVAALVYAEMPILAALYLVTVLFINLGVQSNLKEGGAK